MNEPAIYFDTDHADDRAFADDLNLLAYDRGISRLPGESDHELRDRLRLLESRPNGSLEAIAHAVEALPDVISCDVTHVHDVDDSYLDVEVRAVGSRPTHVLRGEIESRLRASVALGIVWRTSIKYQRRRRESMFGYERGWLDEDLD